MSAEASGTVGKPIRCRAAVAWEAKQPLDVTEIDVAPPRCGEVRVKIIANALCHTDVYTLEGSDPEGKFPCVLGHEAAGIVESVGEGVTSVKVGDVVIPCYTPECKEFDCIFCQSPKTNLCPKIRATQGKGLMPDGTTRLSKDGKEIYHFMGCSTFAEYAVMPEISLAKINPAADLEQVCLLGCGVATGWGAVRNTMKVEPGASVVVFGLGALGLAVIQAAKATGASTIVGVDMNGSKESAALQFGATEFVNPTTACPEGIKPYLLSKAKWGYDYTFDCTGNVRVMRDAFEVAHRGWGKSCIIGVAPAGKEVTTVPFHMVTGRWWTGTAFGGWKSRTDVPKLVQEVMRGESELKPYITARFSGLENVNKAIEKLHSGDCLRAVVCIAPSALPVARTPTLKGRNMLEGGWLTQLSHWSDSCQCDMTFSVFIPPLPSRLSAPPAVVYYLSGLTCTDDNARTKSNFAREAARVGVAVVFPDTSPRGVDVPGEDESYDIGSGAGFYVNAVKEPWAKHYKMYDYVTKELPDIVSRLFAVDPERKSIMGHSMGGHGALVAHLRNPGMYRSVSAFAPICNPTKCEWGQKAFTAYLGDVAAGVEYDATELMASYQGSTQVPVLIDQGTADNFLDTQLRTSNFVAAAARRSYPITCRMQPHYDHSYHFIATFMKDHIDHHARVLGATPSC